VGDSELWEANKIQANASILEQKVENYPQQSNCLYQHDINLVLGTSASACPKE
jgi:hypothetical protein